ncbi:MAG TPA: hypothetical protein VGI92_05175 [Gemmatimonadales bacterium]
MLGAGASVHAGLPLGVDLFRAVLNGDLAKTLVGCGYEKEAVSAFQRALVASGRTSVDAFLEHRTEFLDVGKAAIAAALLPLERTGPLNAPGSRPHWYDYLWERMNAPFHSLARNALTVITFNYDRSLEYYLWHALANAYGKDPAATTAVYNAFNILHVHGWLGSLGELPYQSAATSQHVRGAADRIRIVHEADQERDAFDMARMALQNAEAIYFAGFHYHRSNVERLRMRDASPGARIYGSTLGMTGAEESAVRGLIPGMQSVREPALDFLRSVEPLDV